jgi:uncharacterized phage-associated protein
MSYNASDIAIKILSKTNDSDSGELISNMKLQKLLYYVQGFHLAVFDTPLFDEEIEAWMYGPVVPCVYNLYKNYDRQGIPTPANEPVIMNENREALFNEVLRVYGEYSAIGLMNLTHNESPWKNVFHNNPKGIISKDSMKDFFKTRLV